MKRLTLSAAAIVLAAPTVLTGPTAAQEADGRILAMSCMNCHGPGGKSLGEIPSISGRTADYIKNAMVDFREGKRTGTTIMTRLAKGYSDAEIAALADYIATLK